MITSSLVSMRRESFLRSVVAPATISGVAKEYLGWKKEDQATAEQGLAVFDKLYLV